MGFFFLLTLWWDANLVYLKDAEFDGRTSGAAYQTYLVVDKILGPLIGAGKFLGEGFLIFGIVTGLATIVWNLSFQSRVLPILARRALRPDGGDASEELPRPQVPGPLLALAQIHRRDDYAAGERAIGAREGDGPGTIWGRGGPVCVFSCRGETL